MSTAVGALADARCGATTSVAIGDRSYLFRLPSHASCHDGQQLPLLLLVHCYGCTATHEMDKFSARADLRGFALVAPGGISNSFNAPHCCGAARTHNIDDVGLIDSIAAQLVATGRISPTALFASGFSNGGFLVSHLADPFVSKTRWAAIAPAAGHEYAVKRSEPLPVFIHHCSFDTSVRPSGCCATESGPTCCCGIGNHRNACVPLPALHSEWLRTNRCSSWVRVRGGDSRAGEVRGGKTLMPQLRGDSRGGEVRGSEVSDDSGATASEPEADWECTVGVGCAANATLCMHARSSSPAMPRAIRSTGGVPGRCWHGEWSTHFPAVDEVLQFFAQTACTSHGGEVIHGVAERGEAASSRPGSRTNYDADGDALESEGEGNDRYPMVKALGLAAWRCRCPKGRLGRLCLGEVDEMSNSCPGGMVTAAAAAAVRAVEETLVEMAAAAETAAAARAQPAATICEAQPVATLHELESSELVDAELAIREARSGVLQSPDLLFLIFTSLKAEEHAVPALVCKAWSVALRAAPFRILRPASRIPRPAPHFCRPKALAVLPGGERMAILSVPGRNALRLRHRQRMRVHIVDKELQRQCMLGDKASGVKFGLVRGLAAGDDGLYVSEDCPVRLRRFELDTFAVVAERTCDIMLTPMHLHLGKHRGYYELALAPGGVLFVVARKKWTDPPPLMGNRSYELLALDALSLALRFKVLHTLSAGSYLSGLAVCGDELYVGSRSTPSIYVLSLSGEPRRVISSQPGGWRVPSSLCCVADRLYLIEGKEHPRSSRRRSDDDEEEARAKRLTARRIFVLTTEGHTLRVYYPPKPEEEVEVGWMGMCHFDGKLMVADYKQHEVLALQGL